MGSGRALARLQLLLCLLLALVCLVPQVTSQQLGSLPPPMSKAARRQQRRKEKRKAKRLYNMRRWKKVNGRRVSQVDNFDFQSLQKWTPRKSRAMAAMRSDIALLLPEHSGDGVANRTGIVTYSYRVNPVTIRIFGYVQDETKEELARPENATFTLYYCEKTRDLQGNVRLYDQLYSYRSQGDELTLTELPVNEAVCDLPQSLAHRASPQLNSRRTLHDHHDHSHEQGQEDEAGQSHDSPRHKHHLQHVARVLATGKSQRPFLIFINFDIKEGPHPQWGDVSGLVNCPKSFRTPERLQSIVDEVREDYAPFDVEVTTDKAVYDAWEFNRVKANVVDKVMLSGKLMSCGLALMNTYSQADNTVWASCDCGGPGATAGTISHEVGHTFGLRHDGDESRPEGKTTREYLFSLPKFDTQPNWPKSRRWNTIMGGSIETGVRQWSCGMYKDATNPGQDDVRMLRDAIGQRPGMRCDQTFPLRDLFDGEAFTLPETAIICAGGQDEYFVHMAPGPCKIEITTPEFSNLKFKMSLFAVDADTLQTLGSPIREVESNPYVSRTTTLKGTLKRAGSYLITVKSIAQTASDANNGYNFDDYGSMGFYTLMVNPTGADDNFTLESPAPPEVEEPSSPGAQSCYTWPGSGMQTIFSPDIGGPEMVDVQEDQAMIFGVRFKVAVPGTILAVRFFKSPREGGGIHIGRVYDWQSSQLLASSADEYSGTVVDDAACPGPGWITIDLPEPLHVEPGKEYVATLDNVKYYAESQNQLQKAWANGNIKAVKSGTVFGMEGDRGMPTDTNRGSTNYWIDVVFAAAETNLEDATSVYVPPKDVICATWPINGYQTIFGRNNVPKEKDIQYSAGTDARLVIGLRFKTATEGYITAVRFYKSASESGDGHEGRLYDWGTGELLATTIDRVDDVECGEGWVSIPLKVPFYTSVDAEYVVALDGVASYVKSSRVLTRSVVLGDLISIQEGSVYGQTSGEMPAETWLGSTNYYVDVEFTRDLSLSAQAVKPIAKKTVAPTKAPTKRKKAVKTAAPTRKQATTTSKKTPAPTKKSITRPTRKPTKAPRLPTKRPTMAPTRKPTKKPTKVPTKAPAKKPTKKPTKAPTRKPTRKPTRGPTKRPTLLSKLKDAVQKSSGTQQDENGKNLIDFDSPNIMWFDEVQSSQALETTDEEASDATDWQASEPLNDEQASEATPEGASEATDEDTDWVNYENEASD